MTEERFVELVRAESGLDITQSGLSTPFDGIAGWDSLYLLKVITAVEGETGRPVSVSLLIPTVIVVPPSE